MKRIYTLILVLFAISSMQISAQDQEESQDDNNDENEYREYRSERRRTREKEYHHINTIFNNRGQKASGGYLAMTNKFTTIRGDFSNIVELYGGWYINHHFLLGISAAASTNHLPVPYQYSTSPMYNMSYEYGQAGLMTEFVIASDRVVHVSFQLFAGGGFTLQYPTYDWDDSDYWNNVDNIEHDENWFYVVEPGAKIEVNIFRWLRFCPGVSYRRVHGSDGRGMSDKNLHGASVNMTLKIGKF
jgi:hypothetical protein